MSESDAIPLWYLDHLLLTRPTWHPASGLGSTSGAGHLHNLPYLPLWPGRSLGGAFQHHCIKIQGHQFTKPEVKIKNDISIISHHLSCGNIIGIQTDLLSLSTSGQFDCQIIILNWNSPLEWFQTWIYYEWLMNNKNISEIGKASEAANNYLKMMRMDLTACNNAEDEIFGLGQEKVRIRGV